MKLFLITGTTKGLGKSLVELVHSAGNHCICVSRAADSNREGYWQISADFKSDQSYLKKIESLILSLDLSKYSHLVLINNAAVVEPIGRAEQIDLSEISASLRVNLQTPMQMTSLFLSLVKSHPAKKIILNISSGAGYRPIENWATYCASKAALNMYTQCLSLEHKHQDKYYFFNFSPGVMDTQMQGHIREKTKEEFSGVDYFLALKDNRQLRDPRQVAEQILKLVDQVENFKKVDYDISEFNEFRN